MNQRPCSVRKEGKTRRALTLFVWALGGALAVSTLILLYEGYSWVGWTSETGGVTYNLVWLARLLIHTLFQSPWGVLGAVLGAAVGWVALSQTRRAFRQTSKPGHL